MWYFKSILSFNVFLILELISTILISNNLYTVDDHEYCRDNVFHGAQNVRTDGFLTVRI